MTFGSFFRARRDSLGLTRGQVAHAVGCSESAIANVENGWNCIPLPDLGAWFDALSMDDGQRAEAIRLAADFEPKRAAVAEAS